MRKKGFVLRNFNARALKSAVFSTISVLRPLRDYLNYYQDMECFELRAQKGSLRSLEIRPVEDYGIRFSEAEILDILRDCDTSSDALKLVYKMARIGDVTVLGSSGVSVCNRSRKVLYLDGTAGRTPRNWLVARPLQAVDGDETATYINLLGVRRGHRHFAHFLWDTLVPVMVFVKNWLDPAERIVFLVREDLSAIQRDAFRFLSEDYPNVSFQPLAADRKLHCSSSIYLAAQHLYYGVANTMAREYMRALAKLFLKHYDIAAPAPDAGKRLYISREGAELRKPKNEAQLMKMLSRYGFESYDTAKLPFAEQARLFQSADVVVAPHGAALANLMFCRPHTKVLEFFPANYRDDCFLRLSKAMELEYHYHFGERGDFPKLPFRMDEESLETLVRALL